MICSLTVSLRKFHIRGHSIILQSCDVDKTLNICKEEPHYVCKKLISLNVEPKLIVCSTDKGINGETNANKCQ